ncbi:MAG: hypothetical protein ACE37B_05275 [Ilumatobacter sp.]|uniref:hypothetical protein n=1 Tax=Ilumatobacter sp. TaxID=1967498 RepID=UPI00391B4C3B
MVDDVADEAEVAARLDAADRALAELQADSRRRQAELKAIAADLPAVTSRRVVIKELAVSVRDAPDKGTVATRTLSKIARLPGEFIARLRR